MEVWNISAIVGLDHRVRDAFIRRVGAHCRHQIRFIPDIMSIIGYVPLVHGDDLREVHIGILRHDPPADLYHFLADFAEEFRRGLVDSLIKQWRAFEPPSIPLFSTRVDCWRMVFVNVWTSRRA